MIRRTILLFAVVVLAAACEKDDTPSSALTVSTSRLLLKGTAQSQTVFTVTANQAWEIRTAGSGFTAEPLAGGAGTTAVTVTATQHNPAPERTDLGSVTVTIPGTRHRRTVTVEQSPGKAPQSVFLYMAGTDLLKYFRLNIERSCKAVTANVPGDGRFLAMVQPASQSALILEILYDPATRAARVDTLARKTGIVSTRRETITSLLGEMAALAPAERYGLILGSHGSAWVPSRYQYLSQSLTPSKDYWRKNGVLETRWFGSDGGVRTDITTLASAIEETGIGFDYLIFDACFMSSVETLYDLKDCTENVIGAPTEIMGYGFPYDRILPKLFTQNGAVCDLKGVCKAYYDFYLNDWQSLPGNAQSGCIALTKCSELSALAGAMKAINNGKKRQYDPQSLQHYENLTPHLFYDLGQYAEAICDDPALVDSFQKQFDKAFPPACRLHTPTFYSAYGSGAYIDVDRYSGVSTSEPSGKYTAENRQTAWYLETH